MSEGGGQHTVIEQREWLRWLVEDSLLLEAWEKLALLGQIDNLKEDERHKLLEILLNERRLLDRVSRRAYDMETPG